MNQNTPIDFDQKDWETWQKGWEILQKGITKLTKILEEEGENVRRPFNIEEYMELYTKVYNICILKTPKNDNYYHKELYNKYRNSIEEYLGSTVLPSLKEKNDKFMLVDLRKRWSNHKVMSMWLSKLFTYLERYFLKLFSLDSLYEIGIDCFRNLIYTELNVKFGDAIISLIEEEREGGQIDGALVKNVVDVFVEIGMENVDIYEKDFEAKFLQDTVAYYSQKSSKWILEDSCPEYMVKVEETLKLEKDRVAHYLPLSTEEKLLEKVQHELLSMHSTQLLEKEHSGCFALLSEDKVQDLSRMYRLFSKIPQGLEPIVKLFKQHVTNEGKTLVKQVEEEAKNNNNKKDVMGSVFVRKVIELHEKYLAYVEGCFMNDLLFPKALKEAFEVFCNKGINGSSSAEIFASFCENMLKKTSGSEKMSDEAIEETLEKVVKMLPYVDDKDLFAEFCRKKLARRLLFDRSAGEELEKSFLTKLKQQCGAQFTSKMEGMVTDMILSKENQANFGKYLKNDKNNPLGIDLNVTILNTAFWPNYKSSLDINLPAELAKCVEVFCEFYYDSKANKKKLTWIYSLGTCNINGNFGQKTIELNVTTYQASTLLLFNDSDKLSYEEIKTQTNLSSDDVTRILQSLSCGKYKILNKDSNTKTVSHTDVFEFNAKFTDKMRRIKIPLPQAEEEKKKIKEEVDKERVYLIDASIVRIMKSRKVLGCQELVMECIEQLRHTIFKPDLKAIKMRIDGLIARDYLERDGDNPNVFKYVA